MSVQTEAISYAKQRLSFVASSRRHTEVNQLSSLGPQKLFALAAHSSAYRGTMNKSCMQLSSLRALWSHFALACSLEALHTACWVGIISCAVLLRIKHICAVVYVCCCMCYYYSCCACVFLWKKKKKCSCWQWQPILVICIECVSRRISLTSRPKHWSFEPDTVKTTCSSRIWTRRPSTLVDSRHRRYFDTWLTILFPRLVLSF